MASPSTQNSAVVPLAKAMETTRLDTHTYAVNLHQCFCTGTVPNGGYASATLLQAAHLHLSRRKQPDTVAAHFAFVNPTEVGPAVITVEDVKLGRTLSVLHLVLYQRGLLPHAPWITPGTSRKELVAYVTNGDIASERGVSAPTSFLPLLASSPAPPAPADLSLLPTGRDPLWHRMPAPRGGPFGRIRSFANVEYFAPRRGQPDPSRIDLWIRLTGGDGEGAAALFTNASLAYAADAWPYVVEQYRPTRGSSEGPYAHDRAFWYPTVALNLEVKKALPAAGAEWLFVREATKMVRNGRFDVEVVMLDAEGGLVAVASHVAMIVDAARNLGRGKGKEAAGRGEGKL